MAARLGAEPGIHVVNDVVLNQVLVRFTSPEHDPDELTRDVVRRVQNDGTCWLSGSIFAGNAVMRISVCSWQTSTTDIDRSADAIIRCLHQALDRRPQVSKDRLSSAAPQPRLNTIGTIPAVSALQPRIPPRAQGPRAARCHSRRDPTSRVSSKHRLRLCQ
jgi:hypothetical protein